MTIWHFIWEWAQTSLIFLTFWMAFRMSDRVWRVEQRDEQQQYKRRVG